MAEGPTTEIRKGIRTAEAINDKSVNTKLNAVMRKISILSFFLTTVLSVLGQGYVQVTKIHEEPIMQQFLTMETGAGALTPRFYYNTFHKRYQRTANVENKQIFRLHMKARVADEKAYADTIKSIMVRRAKAEARNVLDRSPLTDMSWQAEKGKIEGKLEIFQRNINNIMPYGGTPEDYSQWKNIYNCFQTAIKVTRESYQDLGKRKKEYMAIYRDIVNRNYQLTQKLLAWNGVKKAREMAKNSKSPRRLSPVSTTAYDALNRWKAAMAVDGFSKGKRK